MITLLIVPTHQYRTKQPSLLSISDFPAGFAYIAASLKANGHDVIGLNPNNHPEYKEPYYMLANLIGETLAKHKPGLIGLGGICVDYAFIKDAIDLCRKFAPGVPIVLGGGIISNDREDVFRILQPDFGLIGEAEETIVRLCNALEGRDKIEDIPNLSYWRDKNPVHNPVNHEYGELDARPFPDYEAFGGLEMVDRYSMATRVLYRYTRTHPRPFTIVTARSCPFSCTFCVHRGGPKYRARSIENIMEEIRVNWEKYRFNILIILDELFAVNKARMREFCEALLEGKRRYGWDFDWMMQTHASAALDYDTLKLAKEAGLTFFSYGLESASPTVLKSMNKRMRPTQIIEALKLAEEVGIGFGGNLIFGDPAETEQTIHESLNFYWDYCRGAMVFLADLRPYPGNKLFDFCVEYGLIPDKKEYYETIDSHPFNMTRIPNNRWVQWLTYFNITEGAWFGFKQTMALSVELDNELPDEVARILGRQMYRVKAICPHCGEMIEYREMLVPGVMPEYLGTGCPKCGYRIRVGLKVGEYADTMEVKELVKA